MKYDITKIPEGDYCYNKDNFCPYWSQRSDKPKQLNGFCSLMGIGDWMSYQVPGLLWDQVKCCNINIGDEEI